MTNRELKEYINTVNDYTDTNTSKYKEVLRTLPYLNQNSPEDMEIYKMAVNKKIIN